MHYGMTINELGEYVHKKKDDMRPALKGQKFSQQKK